MALLRLGADTVDADAHPDAAQQNTDSLSKTVDSVAGFGLLGNGNGLNGSVWRLSNLFNASMGLGERYPVNQEKVAAHNSRSKAGQNSRQ